MPNCEGPQGVAGRLLGGTALGLVLALPAAAGEAPPGNGQQPRQQPPEQVIITGQRPEDFRSTIPSVPRLTEPLIDTPQSIDVISEQLLRDRAVTNLNDALRSVPGISIGAGEFSWQGNNPTIRGFVARNDMFLDGIRDFGSYYRDPFYMQSIEVLQGPSSILFGRGSTGGVINQSSKLPMLDGFVRGTITAGSDLTRRATVDIGEPLPNLAEGAAFRFNAMVHAQSVAGRNAAKQSRFGLAPSLALGIGAPTRLMLSYYDLTADDVPDYGVPWFGTVPAAVPRQNFYGFDSDYLRTGTDVGTLRVEHDFNATFTLRNTVRYAYYTRRFRIAEPIVAAPAGTDPSLVEVSFNIFSGDSIETMAWDQLDAVAHFDTGPLDHTLVAGIEGGRESSTPAFRNSAGVPTVPLLHPDPRRPFGAASTYPRFDASAVGWSFGVYAIDTIKLGERWELNAGVRWDSFDVRYRTTRFSVPPAATGVVVGTDDIERVDRIPSYRGALVYKPQPNGSLYFAYGTSFNPSAESLNFIVNARGFGVGNKDLAPEENETFEVGAKWDVLDGMLSLTAAAFRLDKSNARVPDPTNPGFNMLEGGQRVDGFDAGILGRLSENWQISLGYSYLDGKVTNTSDTPGAAAIGAPLVQTPRNSLSFFTEYRLGGGFEIGGGATMMSSRFATNVAPVKKVPGYWTFDLMGKYDFSERMSLQLNVNNVFDRYYYEGLHPFHVVPGMGRVALLTLNFSY